MVRFASGIALAAVALAAIFFLPIVALRVVACVVAALAAYEYLEIVDTPIRALVLAVALCWVSSDTTLPPAQLLLMMALASDVWSVWSRLCRDAARDARGDPGSSGMVCDSVAPRYDRCQRFLPVLRRPHARKATIGAVNQPEENH